jgi:hypothetical protein
MSLEKIGMVVIIILLVDLRVTVMPTMIRADTSRENFPDFTFSCSALIPVQLCP